jgi:hypothetical protein
VSSTYAGTATYPATITMPDDGDPANAASVSAPMEGLADRTAYLKPYSSRVVGFKHLATGLLFTGTAPATGWSTDPTLLIALPSDTLTEYGSSALTDRDLVEVHASIEIESGGTNEVWVGLGWYGASFVQIWDHTIRKTSGASSRKRFELCGIQEANGLSASLDSPPKVGIFVYPQSADDALLYGPGGYIVRSMRRA